jgi:hypothetical protein
MINLEKMVTSALLLLPLVIATVEWIKQLGVSGRLATLASMLVGLVFGASYQIATVGTPTAFDGWFSVSTFGLLLGLMASGLYKVGVSMTATALDKTE